MNFHDIEITLVDVAPRTWRRFLLRKAARTTLQTLHQGIQVAAAWQNDHLYAFHAAGASKSQRSSPPLPEQMKLGTVFAGPARLRYNYDFGDNWWVDVVHHGIIERAGDEERVLTDGANPWAPDDCGGIHGFAEIQRVMRKAASATPLTADEADRLEWAGDSAAFDIEALRRRFHRAGSRSRPSDKAK